MIQKHHDNDIWISWALQQSIKKKKNWTKYNGLKCMNNTCQCTTNHIILNWISKHKMDEWACTQITFLLLFAHMTIIYDFFFYVFFSKEYSRGSAILARHIDTSCKGKFPICLDQQTTIIVRCLQYVRVAYSLWIIKFYNILCRARQQSFLRPATLWSTHNRR